jgi:hypothetical protein
VADSTTYFERLGDLVDQRWTTKGRGSEQLAEVATEALLEVPVPDDLTPSSILGWLAVGTSLPKQRSSSDQFGQPPAVMYKKKDLEIQALTWMDGTTAIHQHGFDGAFRVLAGSSLHVEHTFQQSQTLADGHLVTGTLGAGDPEILWPGDVRPIVAGSEFIHALFHLERPSVTIVVRNHSSDLPFPQYTYRLPGLGLDDFHTDDRLVMRLRGLHSLQRLDRTEAARVAREIVRSQDLWSAFKVCDYWAYNCGDGPAFQTLVDELADRACPMADLVRPMFAEEMRRGRILARRGMLTEQSHRLFLALIVNLPDRRSIHTAISQLYPDDDPDLVILRWVEELASPSYRGMSGLTLGVEQMEVLQTKLLDGGVDDALGEVASRWNPPSLLEKLFA